MNANYSQVKLYRDALVEFIESGEARDRIDVMVELNRVDKWLLHNHKTGMIGETLEIPSDLKMIEI